jgi:hypothetical protein
MNTPECDVGLGELEFDITGNVRIGLGLDHLADDRLLGLLVREED